MTIRKTSASNGRRLEVEIQVQREKVIDCGADVDYINKEWCQKKGFKKIKRIRFGKVKGFDGKKKRFENSTRNSKHSISSTKKIPSKNVHRIPREERNLG